MTGKRLSPDQEWRRLLRGGFAFASAPFAAHPLDRDRARRMRFLALRSAATDEAILDEARRYLGSEVGIRPEQVDDRLSAVRRFLVTCRSTDRKARAWLVYEAGTTEERRVITVLDSRKSVDGVAALVEHLYAIDTYSLREKLHFASRKKDNPYSVAVETIGGGSVITCGHNPWIEARMVRNLSLLQDEEGNEMLTWE